MRTDAKTARKIGALYFDEETILEVKQLGGGGAGVGGANGLNARNLVTGEDTGEVIAQQAGQIEQQGEQIDTLTAQNTELSEENTQLQAEKAELTQQLEEAEAKKLEYFILEITLTRGQNSNGVPYPYVSILQPGGNPIITFDTQYNTKISYPIIENRTIAVGFGGNSIAGATLVNQSVPDLVTRVSHTSREINIYFSTVAAEWIKTHQGEKASVTISVDF